MSEDNENSTDKNYMKNEFNELKKFVWNKVAKDGSYLKINRLLPYFLPFCL